MQDSRFDNLARRLARPLSRRQLCKTLLGTAIGGLSVRSGLHDAFAANNNCAHFCNAVYPPGPARGECKSDAAQGLGVCFQCGPAVAGAGTQMCGIGTPSAACCPPQAPTCCDQTSCVDLTSDPNNCGGCDIVCNSGSTCVAGKCVESGVCPFGGTCGNFPVGCNGNTTCVCYTTLAGIACGLNLNCNDALACNVDAPCPDGSFCAVSLCCQGGDAKNGRCVPTCPAGVTSQANALLDPSAMTTTGF